MSLATSWYYVKWCNYIWIYIYIYTYFIYIFFLCVHTSEPRHRWRTIAYTPWRVIQPTLIHECLATYPFAASCGKFQLLCSQENGVVLEGKTCIGVSFPGLFPWEVVGAGLFCKFFLREARRNGVMALLVSLDSHSSPTNCWGCLSPEEREGLQKERDFWAARSISAFGCLFGSTVCVCHLRPFVGFHSGDFRIGCWIQTNVSDHLLWGLVFDKACMYMGTMESSPQLETMELKFSSSLLLYA